MHFLTKLKPDLRSEWWSKLVDGILAAVILLLTWLVVTLSTWPIERVFGTPGLLIYILGLLAVSMYALQQALVFSYAETTRAWFGTAAGFLAWSVVQVCTRIGMPIVNPGGIVILIMVSLITALFWRRFLPVGARFFSLTFLLNWVSFTVMSAQAWLAGLSPIFTLTYRATGYLSLLAVVLVAAWLLFRSRRRLHRLSSALAIWFLLSLSIYVFYGSLY